MGYLKKRQLGFTLIELAMVVFIISLLMAGILVPISQQVKIHKTSEAKKQLVEIHEALLGYAAANGYLPCPDTTGDGEADAGCSGANISTEGVVPWVDLQVDPVDAWGRLFLYRVHGEFAGTGAAAVTPCVPDDGRIGLCDTSQTNPITIQRRDANKVLAGLALSAPAVVISFGPNQLGATDLSGNIAAAPTGADELDNSDGADAAYISRNYTEGAAGCSDTVAASVYCEFDDLVTWVSYPVLFNRMVMAERLP